MGDTKNPRWVVETRKSIHIKHPVGYLYDTKLGVTYIWNKINGKVNYLRLPTDPKLPKYVHAMVEKMAEEYHD